MHGLLLSGVLLVWPPPKQIERAGLKDPDSILLHLAAVHTDSLRPVTSLLQLEIIDDASLQNATVLKRSNSDCGKHVIFPEERRKRNVEYLKELSPHGERWLMQEYVPTMKNVGEWRTFIVNGAIIHTVHTYNGDAGWEAKLVATMWSLREIK